MSAASASPALPLSPTSELILVTGFSGIGKTVVVNEVHKPIVKQRGYFIKGKFDQFNRNIPLSAFVQAFRDLMRQLLSESDAQLHHWQRQILAAVGENGQVMIDVIPELKQIIGAQPVAVKLSGTADQNRFNLLFQKFIQVFATPDHPLVMFLDDLQWADSASLHLLHLLMAESAIPCLLVIGAYRDHEVSPVHPLSLMLESLSQANVPVRTIALAPLSQDSLNQLVAHTLNCAAALAQPLTELIYQKTQGNPFFATQFLKALHQDGLIHFNTEFGYWQGDIARIRELVLTDDVVDFMALQIQKLPPDTQTVLKLAACIGNQFDLATLSIVYQHSEMETAADLWSALQARLVVPTHEVYKFYQVQANISPADLPHPTVCLSNLTYHFLHDRIQQAAASLITPDQKQMTHLQMGQMLLQNTPEPQREERLFAIINHLNAGAALITDPEERTHLAQLNLAAGRKAKSATAYVAAIDYLTAGIRMLPGDAWAHYYDLTLAIHIEVTEVAYLNTDFEQMEQWAMVVLHHAKALLDTIPVQKTRLLGAKAQGQLRESLQIGLQVLQALGMGFPEQPTLADIDQTLTRTRQLWQGRSVLSLLNLPIMHHPGHLAAMEMMTVLVPSAYRVLPNLMPLLICQQVELSMQSGNCSISIFSYGDYGLLLCGAIGEMDAGYEFGQLSLAMLDRLQATVCHSRIGYIVHYFVSHWKEPLQQQLQPLLAAYQSGLETGDLECVALNAHAYCYYSLWAGQELTGLAKAMEAYCQAIQRTKQEVILKWLNTAQQLVLSLLGSRDLPWQSKAGDEPARSQPCHDETCDRTTIFHDQFSQMVLAYLFMQYATAAHHAAQLEHYLDGGLAIFPFALYPFYDALIQLAQYSQTSVEQQSVMLERIQTQQDKIQEWATLAPFNHQHRWELIEAERQALLHDRVRACDHYDRAIAGAKEHGFIQDEALANELAARFYLAWGKERLAQEYLINAYDRYKCWGATAKLHDLEQRYPQILLPIVQPSPTAINTLILSGNSSHLSTALDLSTLLQAFHTLSSEIQLDQLLPTLIQLVMTNAGADKAALFLNSGGVLEVGIKYFDNAVQLLKRKPIDDCQHVPLALIHYVERTRETVITDYKTHPSTITDPYCLQFRPQSLLCTPILNQGKLVAVLYLENTMAAAAFTDDRVELLKVLCAQAAISLENAHLYQQAQTYAQQLETSLSQLQESETRFQHLATNLPGMIFQLHVTADGTISVPYASSGCYNLYEVTAEAMIAGQYSFREFEHPDDRSLIEQMMAETSRSLQPFNLEFRIVTRSGLTKWIHVVSQPTSQSQGALAWDGLVMDVSDRKRAELERDRLVQDLSQLNTSLEQANRQLEEYSQTLEQRVAARTQELSQALSHLQAAQQDLIQSEKLVALGQLTASIAHEINTPLGVIRGATNNITAAFQASLQQLPTLLQHLSETQRSEFLALVNTACQNHTSLSTRTERQHRSQLHAELVRQGIVEAHAIATQLTLLRLKPDLTCYQSLLKSANCLEILQTAYHLVLQAQNARSIQQEVDRAAKIVFALKTYSHHSPGGESCQVWIPDGIEVALTLYHNRLKQGINVIRCYDSEIPEIIGNPDELTQVWVNLIDNAIYAIGQRGTLEIAIRSRVEQLMVEVADSGSGIPADIQSRIFEPFYTTKPRGEGSGLGLDIVRRIVTKHNGSIAVHSQPGRTVFTVMLPLSPSASGNQSGYGHSPPEPPDSGTL
ncbi:trifunctional serine/threonine-protein kinase/ATP-binding protein/sensor histidine kinase [Pantanalinema rosaneae CENA516]|uniref:trifunctional serine/threonine-protein kinase/ATP-binding protein/sensor histidine kinase n=1 Tax=Pantanalinema rosaneae TaxID=1620701 RepID=UPI003D6F4D7C